jgi:Reverse transcriptase (RNA-dependent DNA polymerase)
MRRKGYQLTRYADDWVVTCTSAAEARAAIVATQKILEQLGVELHPQKTRVVHVQKGFEFLGYKIKRGQRRLRLMPHKIQSGVRLSLTRWVRLRIRAAMWRQWKTPRRRREALRELGVRICSGER